jgi:glycosyltransferase involved in cell wall biosynthesis
MESLLSLDYPRECYEVICVDNASTDDTVRRLQRFLPHIRIVHEPIRGAAAARNRGVEEARHDVVAFTDADCVVAPGWLRGLAIRLSEPGVGIVGGHIAATAHANAVECFGERIHDHRRAIDDLRPPYAITMNWASPRHVLRDAGLFDISLLRGQDADLAFRIGAAGWTLVYEPTAIVHHANERDVVGLFLEGYTHGRYAPLLRMRHAPTSPGRSRVKQIRLALCRVVQTEILAGTDGTIRDHCYAFTFNAGKAWGEIWTLTVGPPRP